MLNKLKCIVELGRKEFSEVGCAFFAMNVVTLLTGNMDAARNFETKVYEREEKYDEKEAEYSLRVVESYLSRPRDYLLMLAIINNASQDATVEHRMVLYNDHQGLHVCDMFKMKPFNILEGPHLRTFKPQEFAKCLKDVLSARGWNIDTKKSYDELCAVNFPAELKFNLQLSVVYLMVKVKD